MQNLAEVLDNTLLARVDKPSRYLGNEVNSVHKDRRVVELRIALAFPDLYDLGLGNLGLHILYAHLNRQPWLWCERAYAPAVDLESELRTRGLPLFALESKDALGVMDVIGFTLQSELTYTNILNILDLSGIPLRAAGRDDTHPLVCAGGPAVFNPEPLAPFVDFFVIGDGEDAILEVCEVLRVLRGRSRAERLEALAALEGVYVPALYPFETLPDGRVLPVVGAPLIRKRITRDLDEAPFPTDYIVPFTRQVHDRISLEVLRGCTQGCRFCQAGMTTRPVRERSLSKVDELLRETQRTTGYEEVSLVSLSTCDYSRVRQLVENTVAWAKPQRIGVSLPSLRLDSFSVELADMVADVRRTGLTVAPEAASPRLRALINKWIPDEDLLEMTGAAYERGWDHVKMYFMIGLPTERDDDIEAIADLALRTVARGRTIHPKAKAHLGVSTFVPKPFTPFQWAAQIPMEETSRRQEILEAALRPHGGKVKFGRHDPEETFLEGLVSRADRRAADLIEAAWRRGARFDAWREHLRFDAWLGAIEEVGYDVADALRERSVDERLPWDHLDVLMDKRWFVEDWQRALELKHAEDCRHRKCHKCGVIDHERELCATMLRDHVKARPLEARWERAPSPPHVEPEPQQRVQLRISRRGPARWLSHIEATNAWTRALRRAGAPMSYSQGFHPHPKVTFSCALPQGQESDGDYLDVILNDRVDPAELLDRLRATLPEGFGAHAAAEVPLRSPSLMSLNHGAVYLLRFPGGSLAEVRARIADLFDLAEIPVDRKKKVKKARNGRRKRGPQTHQVDIRPMIRQLSAREDGMGVPVVELTVVNVEGLPGKARELVPLLSDAPELVEVVKTETLTERDGGFVPLWQTWPQPALPRVWPLDDGAGSPRPVSPVVEVAG